jgi:hypothetical protein
MWETRSRLYCCRDFVGSRCVPAPTQLQAASRRVALGESAVRFGADSSMVEILELSQGLEVMRRELVGTAEQLRTEMQQRQLERSQRARLES